MAQKLEFLGRKPDRMILHGHYSFLEVDFQIVRRESGCGITGAASPERGAYARHQLLNAKRLDDIIISARIERLNFVAFAISYSEHDDGHITGSTDFGTGFQPGHSRHIYIEDDQVGPLGANFFESFLAAGSFHHRIAV